MKKILLGTVFAVLITATTPSYAYYDTRDNPEFIEIQANQSAFAIPVVGDTKSTQTNFGSKSFLEANKVATKRFQVPHVAIRNPNWGTSDYFVPAVKLILVDRTPYMREWVDAVNRGTSTKAEGFHFQSKEGINIGTGISIAAMVKEEDAATFLYWFGTKNPVVTSEVGSNFASVSYGKSLSEIMDTVVRGYVQAALSNAFMRRSFAEGNATAGDIMENLRKDITAHFAEKGITIDYVGYSGPLDYSNEIQASIDQVFIATQKAQAQAALVQALPFMQAEAEINFRNAQSKAVGQWNGQLPALPTWMIGSDVLNRLLGYMGMPAQLDPTKK